MANVLTVIGVLIIIGSMIFISPVLNEAPRYIRDSFGLVLMFGGLVIVILGFTLDIMNSRLRSIQNQLIE